MSLSSSAVHEQSATPPRLARGGSSYIPISRGASFTSEVSVPVQEPSWSSSLRLEDLTSGRSEFTGFAEEEDEEDEEDQHIAPSSPRLTGTSVHDGDKIGMAETFRDRLLGVFYYQPYCMVMHSLLEMGIRI